MVMGAFYMEEGVSDVDEGASDPDAGRVTLKPRRALQGASDLDAKVSGMEDGASEV